MFGYVVADRSNLTQVQVARYRECYCGLCRAIGQRHGQHSRLSLTYDMTFLVLLLDSLYEPHVDAGASRCLVHPMHKQLHRVSTSYGICGGFKCSPGLLQLPGRLAG